MESHQGSGSLTDVRVLEVSSVIMAPFAGKQLARLGAQVIRVEPPSGDVMRRVGAEAEPGLTGASLSMGDGKLSIAVDLKSERGREELRALIAASDIVLTNHPPRRRQEYGLDWETVREVNPQAVLCTAQGYASDSGLGDAPAYDDTVQAASGVCDIYAKSLGRPRFAPYIMADKICGITIVYAALAALHHRDATGSGQWVDVPMVDVMVDFNLAEQLGDYAFTPPLGDAGWKRTLAPSRTPHQCADGWVCVLPYSDRNWADFVALAGHDHGGEVPFAFNRERNSNTEKVQQIIAEYAASRTLEQIRQECGDRRIPVQSVRTVESLVEDPYLRSRGTVQSVEHPRGFSYTRTSPAITFSASPSVPSRPAAAVDGDRDEVIGLLRDEGFLTG